MAEKSNIVVAGYPKSGNTWACRLVGQAVDCPVQGYLGGKHKEVAAEGSGRASEFQVLKSHARIGNLPGKANIGIYIVRDVRDVVCSGSPYFGAVKKHEERYLEFCALRGQAPQPMVMRMINAAVFGGNYYPGCGVPWGMHVKEYIGTDFHMIRYEDLLADTEGALIDLLERVGLPIDTPRIKEAVEYQSFDAAKARYEKEGVVQKTRLMRKGQAQAWKTELSKTNQKFLSSIYEPLLTELGYE